MMLLYKKYKVEIPTEYVINTNILGRYIIKIVNKLYKLFVSNKQDVSNDRFTRIPKQDIIALLKMDILAVYESFK